MNWPSSPSVFTLSSHRPKLLIVDDEPLIRRVLRYDLSRHYEVIEASSGEEAVDISLREIIPVVLLDLRMGGMSGIETLARLRKMSHWQKVVILTAYADKDSAVSALNLGAYRYLEKPIEPCLLRETVAAAYESRYSETREIPLPSIENLSARGLSQREAEVAVLVLQGKHSCEIGDSLGISPRTVEKHIEHIFLKLRVTSRADLVRKIQEDPLKSFVPETRRKSRSRQTIEDNSHP